MAEDERMLIESLFYEGYEYQEIIQILRTRYDIELSLSTLKRKLKDYNLSRNNVEFDPNELRETVVELDHGWSWMFSGVPQYMAHSPAERCASS